MGSYCLGISIPVRCAGCCSIAGLMFPVSSIPPPRCIIGLGSPAPVVIPQLLKQSAIASHNDSQHAQSQQQEQSQPPQSIPSHIIKRRRSVVGEVMGGAA
ncbi:hypothetical protein FA13DRAFT_1736219 [Coprinellus micaceus]|uniref:Uncharacterized protein n=1 Tax=Coprinellus micaceus TaxID=71717 RepID=A0A4Y7T0T2_COPMI|nr:hypothetical protein FA13DRAFT_1736219 [Coprinellus micaceus]